MNYKNLKLTSLMAVSLVSFMGTSAIAKNNEGVIMTVDGEEVPSSEFIYLFNKNNLQQTQPQTLDEYLQLFEIYRLKVAEAKSLGTDTLDSFKKEVNQYRRELLEPYVTDTLYFSELLAEAMKRDSVLVESSHIMIVRTHDEEKDAKNLQRLDSIRTELLNGADFIQMAKNYSEDKFSSDKGGYLGFSPAGTYPYGFETAVYETPEGEISEIVESHVGWHIVKAGARKLSEDVNRPLRSAEELKNDVARKTASPFDSRYHEIRKRQLADLSKRHPEISIADMSDEQALEVLLSAEEESQYLSNPDYRNLVDEYVNGSLLYVVSVENIWDKASNDTEGLKAFYESNKDRYTWDSPHAKGILVQAQNDSVAAVIKEKVASLAADSIVPFIRKNFRREATADRFNISEGGNALIDNLMFGAPEPETKNKNFPVSFVLEARLVTNPENVDDVRGAVINDYQDYLEKEWVASLRKKHDVVMNKKELTKLKRALK